VITFFYDAILTAAGMLLRGWYILGCLVIVLLHLLADVTFDTDGMIPASLVFQQESIAVLSSSNMDDYWWYQRIAKAHIRYWRLQMVFKLYLGGMGMDIDTDMGIWRLFLSIFSSALDPRLRLLYNYFCFWRLDVMGWERKWS
jgi:hypothetical protein